MHEQARKHPEWCQINKDGQLIYGDRTENFFRNMCELLPDPLIKPIEGIASTARVTLAGRDGYRPLHVKATYPEPRGNFDVVEEHNVLKAGAKLAVKGEYGDILLLPEESPIDFTHHLGYTVIALPKIVGYEMLLLR